MDWFLYDNGLRHERVNSVVQFLPSYVVPTYTVLNIQKHFLSFEKHYYYFIFSKSRNRKCSVRKYILRNFAKFTGKHLCQSLFFHKVAGHLFHRTPLGDYFYFSKYLLRSFNFILQSMQFQPAPNNESPLFILENECICEITYFLSKTSDLEKAPYLNHLLKQVLTSTTRLSSNNRHMQCL